MTDPWLQAARNFTDEEKETALRNLLENNPRTPKPASFASCWAMRKSR